MKDIIMTEDQQMDDAQNEEVEVTSGNGDNFGSTKVVKADSQTGKTITGVDRKPQEDLTARKLMDDARRSGGE